MTWQRSAACLAEYIVARTQTKMEKSTVRSTTVKTVLKFGVLFCLDTLDSGAVLINVNRARSAMISIFE